MSIMKTEDVKTLRDVQSMFNDLDNKLEALKDDVNKRLMRIESDSYSIREAFNNKETRELLCNEIEAQCQAIRELLYESHRSF